MSGFFGRVSVITGAGSGIGQALALELARRGSDLALCDVNEAGLEETARRIGTERKVLTEKVDVADRDAVYAFKDTVLSEFGKADAVVNNAGVTVVDSVNDISWDDFEWLMGINFWGVTYGSKAFLPHFLERDTGWIVNISSVFGIIAVPHQSAYNAAKFAVRGFTESLRQELHGTGVTATCVHPGGIKTNIVRDSRYRNPAMGDANQDEAAEQFEKLARTTPARAATIIADGMEAKDPRILIGPDAELIDRVQRMAPVKYPTVVRELSKRFS
ncbi:MAG: SDR family NAD(P)-dependent oxidoreductase [Sandaracinaceae bacterium]